MNSLFRLRRSKPVPPPGEENGVCHIDGYKTSYVIQRRPRRYRIALYIEASGKLRFVAPLRTRTATITNILDTRADWIASKLHDVRQSPAPAVPQHFEDGETAHYLGTPYKLRILGNSSQPQGCYIQGDHIEIHLSNADNVQQEARLEMMLWYKKEAKRVLKERTDYWAAELQLKYRSMKVTNPLRQWGSCSVKNDIRYNWRVIVGPLAAIDYLVAHELCHIVHKNHSPRFWNLLASVMPDHKQRRQILHGMDTGFSL